MKQNYNNNSTTCDALWHDKYDQCIVYLGVDEEQVHTVYTKVDHGDRVHTVDRYDRLTKLPTH